MSTLLLPEPKIAGRSGLAARVAAVAARPGARGAALSLCDQAVVSGTNFVTSVLIGRAAGADALGVYAMSLSVVMLTRGVQEQLIGGPYQVLCQAKRGRRSDSYLGSAFVHQAMLALVAVLALVVLGIAVAAGVGPAAFSGVAWILAAAAPGLLLREFLRHVAFARLRPGLALVLDATVAAVQISALVVLAWYGMLTVPAAFVVMAAASLLAAAGWFLIRPIAVRVRRPRVLPDWKENWAFGRWALASQLIGGAGLYVMPWAVAATDGAEATGLLAAGGTLVGVANMFVLGLANYLSPQAARAYVDGGIPALRGVLRMTAYTFSGLLGTFAIAAVLAGGAAAALVYGEEFSGAGPVVAVLAFGMWANSMAITAGNGLWAVGRPEANFRADIVALIVTAVATAILVPVFGPVGAAASLLTGGVTDAAIRTLILRRVLRELTVRDAGEPS